MSYQVTARKWRPQVLNELLGQEEFVKSLSNNIKKYYISHAYLFSGPRGTGKTSSARILAKSLNCEKALSINPCQKCSNCIEITNSNSYDVLEIDGASNRGIDQIRELRNNVKYLPNKSRYKIFIIDEVHMLTDQAFNGLLKTLEEPPKHVIFIFATTEMHKVKITIRSRCQHYNFKRISTILIKEKLKEIAIYNKIKVDEKALYYIAKASDGSMRDSQNLFDKLLSYGEKNITAELTEKILGIFPINNYINFIEYFIKKDVGKIITQVKLLLNKGEDLLYYSSGLIEFFRNLLMIINLNESDCQLIEIPKDIILILKNYKEKISSQKVIKIINLLMELNQKIKYSEQQQYLFESYIFKMFQINELKSPEKILEHLDKLQSQITNSQFEIQKVKNPSELKKINDNNTQKEEIKINTQKNITKIEKIYENKSITNKNLNKNYWNIYLNYLSENKTLLYSYLYQVNDFKLENEVLYLYFDNDFYYDEINQLNHKKVLEQIFYKLFNFSINIKSIYNKKDKNNIEEEEKENLQSILKIFKGKIIK